MIDTIPKPMKFKLPIPMENMTIINDSNTGEKVYQISLDSPKMDKSLSVHWEIWSGGLFVVVVAIILWFLSRRSSQSQKSSMVKENAHENALRNELLRQSEAYKVLVAKGYFSGNNKTMPDSLNTQEINAMCDMVVSIFDSFTAWLREKDLSDKDFQFCCLVKSGLSTFELAEICCVSESAIFKRKQKLKVQLGFKSDTRTLDAILQAL
ncbi:MAG: hypothetical protein HUK16_06950 [Bacteroidales bacterium]|nr:hypothetical protein [Bacteroidales bacterium]